MIKRLSHSLLTALTVLALLAGASQGADQPKAGKTDGKATDNKKPDANKKPGDPKAPNAPDDDGQGMKSILGVLPLGQKNIDVRIPSFHEGQPSSFVRAGAMTRMDDQHLDLENTDIRMYGKERPDDLLVSIVTGQFNIDTQVLDSNQRSRVSRDDFQIEGDRMVFDTKSQQGKMEGNVHMIIHDAGAFAKRNSTTANAGKEGDKAADPANANTAKPAKQK
jgi:hypothetical protein